MISEERRKYCQEWKRENMKRIPFDVRKEYYEDVLKPAADEAQEPMNVYIKTAIMMRMEADGFKPRS